MYRFLSKLYPRKIKESYTRLLSYSNIKYHPDHFLGFIMFFGLGIALAMTFYLGVFFKIYFLGTFFLIFVIIEVSVYMVLLLRADAKAKFVESILPDALQLMSSNLRAGLTTDRALLFSARPEFGPFQDELNVVGKEIAMGKEITKALLNITKRIRSDKLEKTVYLINAGLKSGGELSALLEQAAHNLRQQKFVEERIRSNVLMYVIFIFGAVGFGAPLLFGLSSFLVQVLTTTMATVDIPETSISAQLPISFAKATIDPGFVITFAVIALITTSILGGLVLGSIAKGREREGVKFIPVLIILSLSIFFIVRLIIGSVLSGLFEF